MSESPEPTELEVLVLRDLFSKKGIPIGNEAEFFLTIRVAERDFTGVGFFTHFHGCPQLQVGQPGETEHWLGTDAMLNEVEMIGFIIYIEDGQVTCIEGHTYCDEWPDTITKIEICDLDDRDTRVTNEPK